MHVPLIVHSPLKYSPLCFVDRWLWYSHPRVSGRVRRSEELRALCVLYVCRCPLELQKLRLFGSASRNCDELGVEDALRRHCEAFVAGALHGLEFDVMPVSLCEHEEPGFQAGQSRLETVSWAMRAVGRHALCFHARLARRLRCAVSVMCAPAPAPATVAIPSHARIA